MCAVCARVSQLASGTSKPSATCRSTSSAARRSRWSASPARARASRRCPSSGCSSRPGRIAAGSIEFNGRQLVEAPRAPAAGDPGHEIAMIFQDPATCLDPVYTVENQLVEALDDPPATGHERGPGPRRSSCSRWCGMPDPEARMKSYQHQLSGGMRQRVMIAMALALDPQLLIADEPTTALDVTVQAQILDLLARAAAATGMSILFVTHDLGVVAEMADRVVVMYAGRVVEQGSVRAVLKDPRNPYTQALLESMPGRVAGTGERLTPIEGVVPNLFSMPAGCRYAPRCPHAFDRCREESPPLLAVSGSGASRCWLHDSEQLAGARDPDGRRRSTGQPPTAPTPASARCSRSATSSSTSPSAAACCRRPSATSAPSTGCRSTCLAARRSPSSASPVRQDDDRAPRAAAARADERRRVLRGARAAVVLGGRAAPAPPARPDHLPGPVQLARPAHVDRSTSSPRPLEIHGIVDRHDRVDRVAGLLEQVGLSRNDLRKFPHQFSGGQRQRIGIARALATGPSSWCATRPCRRSTYRSRRRSSTC